MTNLSHVVEVHASMQATRRTDNLRPWLPTFLDGVPGARKAIARRVDQLQERPIDAQGRTQQVLRLKPDLRPRDVVLLEVETELALMYAAGHVVDRLDGSRLPDVSYANSIKRHVKLDEYWFVVPFSPHASRRRQYVAAARRMRDTAPWIATSDVKNFYPTTDLALARKVMATEAEVEPRVLNEAFALLSSVASTPGRLPVGPQLSAVIGTAFLNGLDRTLVELLGVENVLRWVDDMDCAVPTSEFGHQVLDVVRSNLSELGLSPHPAKTKVVPAGLWVSTMSSDAEGLDEAPWPTDDASMFTRAQAKAYVHALADDIEDDEKRAMLLAADIHRMIVWGPEIVRRMKTGPDLPSDICDRAVANVTSIAREGAYADPAAETLMHLAASQARVGRDGRQALLECSLDLAVPPRTRAASAWTLAQSGSFDQRIVETIDTVGTHYARRGVFAAAAHAGAKITPHEAARCWN